MFAYALASNLCSEATNKDSLSFLVLSLAGADLLFMSEDLLIHVRGFEESAESSDFIGICLLGMR